MYFYHKGLIIKTLLIAALIGIAGLLPAQPISYTTIDRHALKAPERLSQNLPALVEYLIQEATSETEKARAIYSWMTHHIQYDEAAALQNKRINRFLADILSRKKGICHDYALLFQAMCRHAGINCQVISGYARTDLTTYAFPSSPNHAWNVVWLDGKWHLLDATWGSIEGQDAWMTQYKSSYFLSPPELFVLNHLPNMPMWQLLNCPIAPAVFALDVSAIQVPKDTCFHFTDSIRHFLEWPLRTQKYLEAESTCRLFPSADNTRTLSHAMMDQAAALSDVADSLKAMATPELEHLIFLHWEALNWCQQALMLGSDLQPWQEELHIGLLIDQAVSLWMKAVQSETADPLLVEQARQLLAQAQEQALALPADRYYRAYALEKCQSYLEILNE